MNSCSSCWLERLVRNCKAFFYFITLKEKMKHLVSLLFGCCIVLGLGVMVKSCESSNKSNEIAELKEKIYNCEHSRFEEYIEKHDTVYVEIDLNDSIKEIHQEELKSLKYRLKTAKEARDTVTIIKVQEKTILQQDTIIKYLEKNDTLQKKLIAIQDTTIRKQHGQIEVLQNENKSEKKKKRKAITVAVVSTATAILTTIKAISK